MHTRTTTAEYCRASCSYYSDHNYCDYFVKLYHNFNFKTLARSIIRVDGRRIVRAFVTRKKLHMYSCILHTLMRL